MRKLFEGLIKLLGIVEDHEEIIEEMIKKGTEEFKNGNYEEAEKAWLDVLKREPSVEIMNNLGVLYQKQKKYSKAESYWIKSAKKNDSYAIQNLIALYKFQGKRAEAIKYYEKLQRIDEI